MNLTVKRKIEDKTFSTEITHESFGSEDMAPEEEVKMYESLGYPDIDTGGSFEGRFIFDDESSTVKESEDGEKVTILMNSNKVKVGPDFRTEVLVNLNKLETPEGSILTTKQSVAEAKCLLFEKTIISRIEKSVEEIKSKQSKFENGYPKEITI